MKHPGGRPSHAPNDELRAVVRSHVIVGTPRDLIARLIGIGPETLAKHYGPELEESAARANAKIAQTLYQKALDGDVTSMIFWLKTRARWREERPEAPESGTVAEALRAIADKMPV